MDGDTFRRIRERKLKLTQEELAKRLDITRMTIHRYELGKQPIPKAIEMALQLMQKENE